MAVLFFLLCCLQLQLVFSSDEHGTLFATKTAYRHRFLIENKWQDDGRFLRENCNIVHVTQVIRHGTRSPSKKQVRKLERLHARLMVSFNGRDHLPSLLTGWRSKFHSDFEKRLSPVGREELFLMGKRFHERYAPLMSLSEGSFRFISSGLSRAKESALAFMRGLPFRFDPAAVEDKEKLVRYFAYCQRYQTAVKKNKTALAEYYSFMKGPEMERVVSDVRARFHLDDIDLTADDVELIFVNCGFEIANNVSSFDNSPWCQMIFPQEASVLEYLQDLKQYWRKSYPYKLNYLQSCPLVTEILKSLQNGIEKSHPGSVSLYFGHAETLIPVVTAFGLFKDAEHLRATNMASMSARQFRSARIAPFAGNVALELHRCSGKTEPFHVLRPLVNESPVHWDLCAGRSYCPFETVLAHLSMCSPAQHNQEGMCGRTENVHDEL